MSEWKEYILEDFAEINPTERLPKGTIAKKVAMETLQPFTKKITSYSEEEYKGGTKFRNGDTIMARITPSLENGKTSYVDILNDDEIGFGSTEFIVFRERNDISDKDFIYYLATSPIIRHTAIKSMTGSSGRQRVQTDVVKNHNILVPELSEQKAIASVFSSLDDKIDLLHRQNNTLEEMAETLFKEWFVEGVEDDWEVNELKNYVKIVDNRGKTPPNSFKETNYPLIEANALNDKSRLVTYSVIKKYLAEETFNNWFRNYLKKYNVLITTVGANIGAMSMFVIDKGNIAQNIIGLSANSISPFYLYEVLKYKKNELLSLDIGGVQPSIKVPHLLSLEIIIPPTKKQAEFDHQIIKLVSKMEINYYQIQTLENLRDTLLPKLMSGAVRVAKS